MYRQAEEQGHRDESAAGAFRGTGTATPYSMVVSAMTLQGETRQPLPGATSNRHAQAFRGRKGGPPEHAGRWHERSEEHTSELQSRENLVCRLLLEKKKSCDM